VWERLGRVRGSEYVMCMGEFGPGLGNECVLCVGEFGADLGGEFVLCVRVIVVGFGE